jgi:hypothetical protein
VEIKLEQMVETLQRIRRDHGDENFQAALRGLFRDLLWKKDGDAYIERLLQALGRPEGIDLDSLKAKAREDWEKMSGGGAGAPGSSAGTPTSPAAVVEAAIKQAIPNCKTQAHFDLILNAWQALQVYVNAAYGFDRETAAKAREGLNRLLDLAPQLAATHEKLADNPEATTNRDFVDPPKQMTEAETQKRLLLELEKLTSLEDLAGWYARSRWMIDDSIVSQKLRDELFDSIRAKKAALTN